jgi:hypothetical protein
MKRILVLLYFAVSVLVLLVFDLSLVIPPLGFKNFLNTRRKFQLQESLKRAKGMGRGNVLLSKRILSRLS